MGVLFDCARMWPVRRARAVTLKAHRICRFHQQSLVLGPMRIVAAGTFHAPRVHQTLHEVISLHPVFVPRTIREVCERCFPKFVFFELPETLEFPAHLKADGPVVVFAFDGILQRLPLRMALNTGIVSSYKVESSGVHDISP